MLNNLLGGNSYAKKSQACQQDMKAGSWEVVRWRKQICVCSHFIAQYFV
ncbi:hypothetical protein SAMN05421736_12030 [Evansella caseinilytica]|uniref:Uncharacterized protein n=1 Tax=Evansella caseinilytica TaxID=1503961 RepID=A0A1H3UC29_9BACI|nr:hypothetical protein SAMN05421736_12030 [Evansella caseinilytica]